MKKQKLALALVLALPALVPLLRPGLWAAHDPFHHLFRSFDLDYALRGGELYPRWLPNLGFFYGYPVVNFYAPLGYYLVAFLHWLGLGFIAALKGAFALSFLLAAVTSYIWAEDLFGEEAGLWAAVAYTYFPYHLANAYIRAALAEHLAFVFFPLILWLLRRTIHRPALPDAAYLALAVGGLVITHNLSAFMFAPFAAFYALILLGFSPERRLSAFIRLCAGTAGGMALVAFYWLPALAEVRWIRAGQIVASVTEPLELLSPVWGLFSPFFIHRYTPHQGTPFQHPFGMWQTGWMLAGIAAAALSWRLLSGEQRGMILAAIALEAGAIFLMQSASAPLWRSVRALTYLQFPWRFQAVAGVWGTLLVAPLPLALKQVLFRHNRWSLTRPRVLGTGVLALSTLVWAATGLLGIRWEPLTWPETGQPVVEEKDVNFHSLAQYDYQTALWARIWGGPWLLEYLPATVRVPREEFWLPREGPSPWDEPYPKPSLVELERLCPLDFRFTIEAPQDTYIRWHQFWFPGWQAAVDGVPVEAMPSPQLGLVTVPVTAGRHRVRIWFGDTLSRRWGKVLALVAAVSLLGALARGRRWRALMVIGIVLGMWLILWGWQNLRNSTCVIPQKSWVFLEGRIALLGAASKQEEGVLEATLYWMALGPLDEDLTAFVHLIGPDGRKISQHDGPPCESFSPTTRWEPGEIVPDRHLIPLPEGLPEGDFRLMVGMYRLEPELRNLEVTGPDGKILGSSWSFPVR